MRRAGREPDDRAAGNSWPGGVIRMSGSVPWLGSSLRVVPGGAGGHGAGSRQRGGAVRRGRSEGRHARLVAGGGIAFGLAPGGGRNVWRPRAWPLVRGRSRGCRQWRGGQGGGPGEGADLAVAQAVAGQGEQLAGGGDLGDVAWDPAKSFMPPEAVVACAA